MNLNKVFLYGNLTADPESRALPSGGSVVSFSIATNRTYKDRDGRSQEQTEFHNLVAFGKQADLIGQYMKKGRPIYIEGRLQTRSWDSEGQKRYKTEIVVESFQFATSSTTTDSSRKEVKHQKEEPSFGDETNPEDIPF